MSSNITRLVVIRHGETEWNTDNRFQGHLDSKLTLPGKKQAEAITGALKGEATFGFGAGGGVGMGLGAGVCCILGAGATPPRATCCSSFPTRASS